MLVVDIESSGLSAHKCSILSIGALDLDHPENRSIDLQFSRRLLRGGRQGSSGEGDEGRDERMIHKRERRERYEASAPCLAGL